MIRRLIAGVIFAVMLIVSHMANAGPLEDAQAAYERKDYATALRVWRPLAEQGDAQAQYNLGQMYRNDRPPLGGPV